MHSLQKQQLMSLSFLQQQTSHHLKIANIKLKNVRSFINYVHRISHVCITASTSIIHSSLSVPVGNAVT
ncbi:hypothetical protein V1478_014427 [Vespula squamosa]|uniref:Uncharacterized protein n=1 Tax=Vespula squamosa TaxID=30214 RepID=A0ABD2A8N6_VESSQ